MQAAERSTRNMLTYRNAKHTTFISIVLPSCSCLEHDLFGKPVSTFPDHALLIRSDRLRQVEPTRGDQPDELGLPPGVRLLEDLLEVRTAGAEGDPQPPRASLEALVPGD